MKTIKKSKEIRTMVADLLEASGCSCCRNDDKWYSSINKLGKFLKVPMYKDKSGYDFSKFRSKETK